MPNTANGFPYPADTDPIAQGAAAIQALAAKVDTALRTSAGGRVSIALNNVTSAAVAITFPAGRFSAPPALVATGENTSTYIMSCSAVTATAASVTARYYLGTASTATVTAMWAAEGVG
jgi:hypothetical protein